MIDVEQLGESKPTDATGRFAVMDAYPHLQALLAGTAESELRKELEQLLSHAFPARAPRRRVSIIGKMLRTVSRSSVEESIIVHDVSETGIRITVPAHVELLLAEAIEPTFLLRVETSESSRGDSREWCVRGRLVRLVDARSNGVELAYVFVGLSEAERAGVHHLVQWVRPRTVTSERPGQ